MKINGKQIRTVALKNGILELIDQNKLPFAVEVLYLSTVDEIVCAIKTMQVRGAPAIGATGAFGLAVAMMQSREESWKEDIRKAYQKLLDSRPTAVDLRNCLDEVMDGISDISDYKQAISATIKAAERIADNNAEACRRIGIYGASLIKSGMNVLTHCNAGALATVDYGTALAPIRIAYAHGTEFSVFVDETRPRLQGARLTVFELSQEGIPYKLITDNAAGYYMQKGMISLVITGADRIALNGDTANKIGTYSKAVLAKENGIPFYIAAPATTFDLNTATGSGIHIEERDREEVIMMNQTYITIPEAEVLNPAFDVTPEKYISGYITEFGIFNRDNIHVLHKIIRESTK
ncbi:MAG: S-methyl-5-thioribose-1-phosphate isomerase [Candidatus Cloacimonetes bacterium]|nr:S-methyl-5-thioribose-1-phosphate isomerase [Candidatus Cloacimonadota bacterium]